MKRLLITTAALLALATPAMANQTVTVDGLVSLGSSAGMIYNSAGAEYLLRSQYPQSSRAVQSVPDPHGRRDPMRCALRRV